MNLSLLAARFCMIFLCNVIKKGNVNKTVWFSAALTRQLSSLSLERIGVSFTSDRRTGTMDILRGKRKVWDM